MTGPKATEDARSGLIFTQTVTDFATLLLNSQNELEVDTLNQ